MAIRGTPADNANKWKNRLSAATGDIQAGINRVTVAPGQAAAKQAAAWLANTTAAQEKWVRRTSAVTLQAWQAAASAGVNRVAQGATAKVGKMQSFLEEFTPHLERGQAALQQYPRGSLEANLARMVQNARWNSQFKRSGA